MADQASIQKNFWKLSKMRKKIIIAIGILVFIFFVFLFVKTSKFSPILFQFFFDREISLKKEDSNINLLLLGISGGQHEGPLLTDTIIFTSLDLKKNQATLVSMPRDLWIPDLKAKINTAYYYGETKKKGGGITLAKAVVEKILNKQIDYVVRIDFAGFVEIVDELGGIDVDVERAFDDYEYPVEGKESDLCGHDQSEIEALATFSSQLEVFPCRYSYIHFDKGLQHMDGQTALRFVRSRHAVGEEGSDFARSQRQEKIIQAIKDKVFSVQTILNPVKLVTLYSTLGKNIDTNIQEIEIDDFIKLAQKMKNAEINSAVLDYGDEKKDRAGLLFNPLASADYDNQWVLIPRIGNGDFSEIQKHVDCEIKKGNCTISKTP